MNVYKTCIVLLYKLSCVNFQGYEDHLKSTGASHQTKRGKQTFTPVCLVPIHTVKHRMIGDTTQPYLSLLGRRSHKQEYTLMYSFQKI